MTGRGSSSSSCGACKFLRRRCRCECVFAPYFGYDQASTHFEAVHKVFGASNVSKLLSQLPLQNRSAAAITISYEALARIRDPIYGCVSHILALQLQVMSLQEEIELLGTQMGNSPCSQVPPYQSSKTHQRHVSQFQPITMPNLQNQRGEPVSVDASLRDQIMREQLAEDCLHDQFCTDAEAFVSLPWLDMDYYAALMDVENSAWN